MANQEHLDLLMQGTDVWNLWRKQHPEIQPDLSDADLSYADLSRADLSRANLNEANLSQAKLNEAYLNEADLSRAKLSQTNLSRANLSQTNLSRANLSRAKLNEANLSQANLSQTNLIRADLSQTDLSQTDLSQANLFQADLSQANLFQANLSGADLSGAKLFQAKLSSAVLGDKQHIGPRLADLQWGDTNLAVVDWSRVTVLGDEHEARRRKDDSGRVKDKHRRLVEYREALRAYRQLEAVLQEQELDEEAVRFAYREQIIQRQIFWIQQLYGLWFFSCLVALLTGYGYRLGRIVAAYVTVVFVCAVAYFVLGMFYAPPLSFLDAVLTSVTAFHGRVFSEPFLRPGEPQLWVTAFEAIAGLVIEGTFIAMLTQRFFGK